MAIKERNEYTTYYGVEVDDGKVIWTDEEGNVYAVNDISENMAVLPTVVVTIDEQLDKNNIKDITLAEVNEILLGIGCR